MRRSRRRAGLAAALSALAVSLTGCHGPVACTAIGYIDSVVVELDGAVDRVALVEFCAEGGCSTSLELRTDAPFEIVETLPPQTPEPIASPQPPMFTGAQVDERTWRFQVISGPSPERATVRAIAEDDTVLAKLETTLTWVRVGGSEQCGGPHEAGPIRLQVP
jgi:hypothetical protein